MAQTDDDTSTNRHRNASLALREERGGEEREKGRWRGGRRGREGGERWGGMGWGGMEWKGEGRGEKSGGEEWRLEGRRAGPRAPLENGDTAVSFVLSNKMAVEWIRLGHVGGGGGGDGDAGRGEGRTGGERGEGG